MARCIVFGLENLSSLVNGYFEHNPCPPRNLKVDRIEVIDQGGLTFVDLLKAILRSSSGQDLVIVAHGNIHGKGLIHPLAPGGANAEGEHLQTLMDIDHVREAERSGKPLTEAQQDLKKRETKRRNDMRLNDQWVDQLIDLMKQVRAKRLNFMEWRSCDMGKDRNVLAQFQQFFGARVVGAPKLENIFGSSPVNLLSLEKIPAKFKYDFARFDYPDKWNPKVSNFLRLGDRNWPEEGALFAKTKEDVDEFVKIYINPDGMVRKEIAFHALWKESDESSPLIGPTPILPQSFDYGPNILYAEFFVSGPPIIYSPYW